MFQSFATRSSPDRGALHLPLIRREMATAGIDAFLIPRADAHQGETVAPADERLSWATGFTGSAGLCVVTADDAALFIDGRYTLQARSETDDTLFAYCAVPGEKPADWLAARLQAGATVGFDPWLHTRDEIARLETALAAQDIAVKPVENPLDRAWADRPSPPLGAIVPYDAALAGKTHGEKCAEIAATLRDAGLSAAVLTLPESLAWLLNIRGSDTARLPAPHGFAILAADASVRLFVAPEKLDAAARTHLGTAVTVEPPAAFGAALAGLTGNVGVDPKTAPLWVRDRLAEGSAEIVWQRDPTVLPKACKTAAELAATREAHLRDAGAMAAFLAWLDTAGPSGEETEISVVKALEAARRSSNALLDISFETICGAGPDGAIVHYRVSEDTDRPVTPGDLLLVDSGGQYRDGTTDVTRTVATGPVPEGAARAFTLVLKGMIAISRARWPAGLAGRDLDALARAALWQAGYDYDHGTGHGVGVYLGVHEGPQSLSRRSHEPLLPGMILSNEPGYYREGAFGIRIENLVAVTPPETPEGGDRAMLGFETLTLVPIDRRLILRDLLTGEERAWLDAYHARVLGTVGPTVTEPVFGWLSRVCAPL
ncbi:MAG: aminopeptidase P family protein [Pseudomonadota bacterium]